MGMSFWAGRSCYKHNRMETFLLPPVILFDSFLCYLITYLQYCEGIEFQGMYQIGAYMIQNSLYPLCYLYVRQQANLSKFTPTTVGMFALIAYNLIPNTTILTDSIPVKHLCSGTGIFIYRNGGLWHHMSTYEFVNLLQLIWITTRTIILFYRINSQKLRYTKGGITLEMLILLALTVSTLLAFTPDDFRHAPLVIEVHITIHLCILCCALYIVGRGLHVNTIVDENDEPAYMDEVPKFENVKENFEKYVVRARLYLEPELTNEKIIRIVGTNRTYMAEMMKTMYNDTLNSYLNKLRIEEAKRLLLSDEKLKMETIAEKCGFGTASTFTKAFKKETGVTPHLWRPE